MNIDAGEYKLSNLNKISIVLGKNGCGKSTLLKAVEQQAPALDEWGTSRYITPERGGALVYEANIEQNVTANNEWMNQTRRVNQFAQFRQQTMVQFRRVELNILRQVDKLNKQGIIADIHFDSYLEKINSLLEYIEIRQDTLQTTFKIHSRESGLEIAPTAISSGESELISLAIECLAFSIDLTAGKENLLCLVVRRGFD
jgi:predicted ATPase